MPELIEQKYFKQTCPKLVSASGQRTQGVQGQARHWHVKGIKLKKLADSLEMAPLSPTGKVSKHTKETQSLTCCLRMCLRYFLRPSAVGDLHVITHRLSCVQEAYPHVLDDEFISRELIYYGLYILRFTTEAPIDEISGAPNKDMTKPWVVSDETLTTNEFF
jgi:hypothetical protein